MASLRPPRTFLLPALLFVAALLALALERTDGLDVFASDAVGSLASIAMGLAVAALVLSRVSARR